MEAILGVLKTGDEEPAEGAAAEGGEDRGGLL